MVLAAVPWIFKAPTVILYKIINLFSRRLGCWEGFRLGFRIVLFFLSLSGAIAGVRPAISSSSGTTVFPGYTIKVTPEAEPSIPLNKHVNLLVTLIPSLGTSSEVIDFKFDARMPQHKHGMVTTAKVSKIADLQYKIEGVRLHMPGLWLFEFILVHKSGETRISSPFEMLP